MADYLGLIKSLIDSQQERSPWGDAARIAGGYSEGEKANRLDRGNFVQQYDRQAGTNESNYNREMVDAQDSRNLNEKDALQKLLQTSYILQTRQQPQASRTVSLGGQSRELPSFLNRRPDYDEATMAGARSLQPMLNQRLQSGGSYLPTKATQQPLDDYAKAGLGEQIGSWTGVGAGVMGLLDQAGLLQRGGGAIRNLMGGESAQLTGGTNSIANSLLTTGAGAAGLQLATGQIPAAAGLTRGAVAAPMTRGASVAGGGGAMSTLTGKVLPIAGIASGGYGLMKDRGKAGNAMNGAQVGAGIGTLVGGPIGTAVGAGIGAIGGLIRGAFGQRDPAGSQAKASTVRQLISSATPEQRAEASNAGWDHPDDALASIVLRDTQRRNGLPDTSSQLMEQLFKASEQSPAAVQAAAAEIMRNFGAPAGTQGPTGTQGPAGTTGNPTAPAGRPLGW